MAAKFRKTDPRIWHDEKFRTLSTDEKLFALYCLTSSQTNRIGIFPLSIALAAEQTGYPCDTLGMGMARVFDTLKWRFEKASGVLFLPTWWKYNGSCGPKTMVGNMADLHDVPQTVLITEFMNERRYLTDDEFAVVRRVCQGYAKGMPYPFAFGAQEQEQEQEQNPPLSPPKGGNGGFQDDKPKKRRRNKPAFGTAEEELAKVEAARKRLNGGIQNGQA